MKYWEDWAIEELKDIQKTLSEICIKQFNMLTKVTAKLIELEMKRIQEEL